MIHPRRRLHGRPDSGSVLVITLLFLLALGGLTATLFVLNFRLHRENQHALENLRAFCVAEAGLNESLAVLLENDLDGVRALAYPREIADGTYRVEVIDGRDDEAIDIDRLRLRSVGESGRDAVGVQLMIHHVPTGEYQFAAFGDQGLTLNSNTVTDSYDSEDGAYPARGEYVNDYGNVGSFEQVTMASNVSIYGDALVGPEGVFDDDAPGIDVTGDHEAREISLPQPSITVPAIPLTGAFLSSGTQTILPGNYHFSSLRVNSGTLRIRGPATLVLDKFLIESGAKIVIEAGAGPVKIHGTGNFEMLSNTSITVDTGRARDLTVLLTSDNIAGGAIVDLRSNADLMGTLYAPNARVKLSSNFTLYGSVRAAFVEMASNSRVHFDEGLLYDPDAANIYEPVSWRRLSRAETLALP